MYGYIYIYCTTNLVNNKIYIGKHKSSVFDPTYKGSGKLINRAIKKYGSDNFQTKLICECDNLAELNAAEKFYICQLNSHYTYGTGYNISPGGDGGPTTYGTCLMHLGDKCVHVMPDEIPRYLDMGYVRGATETQKKHISEKAKGRTGPSSTFYGRHHSEYSKKLIGSAAKGRPGFGDQNIAKRPEVRKKISQYALTHSNYFRSHKFYYVNNGEIELRILAEEPVPEGFVKGRIPHCWIHNDANEYYVSVRDLSTKLKSSYARGRLAKV